MLELFLQNLASKPCSFPFSFFPLLLPQLVVFPPFECKLDVVLLALFRSTAKKDDCLFAFLPKIYSVTGACRIFEPSPILTLAMCALNWQNTSTKLRSRRSATGMSPRELGILLSVAVSVVPGARIELATPAFSGRRSTNELPRHW